MRFDEEASSMAGPEGVTSLRLVTGDNPSMGTPRAAVLAGKTPRTPGRANYCKQLCGNDLSSVIVLTADEAGGTRARLFCGSVSTPAGAVAPARRFGPPHKPADYPDFSVR